MNEHVSTKPLQAPNPWCFTCHGRGFLSGTERCHCWFVVEQTGPDPCPCYDGGGAVVTRPPRAPSLDEIDRRFGATVAPAMRPGFQRVGVMGLSTVIVARLGYEARLHEHGDNTAVVERKMLSDYHSCRYCHGTGSMPPYDVTCLCRLRAEAQTRRQEIEQHVADLFERDPAFAVPARYAAWTRGSFSPLWHRRNGAVLAVADKFVEEQGFNLMLAGLNRVGKTSLAYLLVGELRAQGVPCIAVRMTSLIERLQGGIEEHDMHRVFQTLKLHQGVLYLDDLGRERRSEWTLGLLGDLIDHRGAHGLPMLATTNLSKAQLIDYYGAPIGTRLGSPPRGYFMHQHVQDWE